ncbi:MAG: hypothetical protein ABIM30_00385 [candidate division WOR-3 bacterium]
MSITVIFNKEKYLLAHNGSINTFPFTEYLKEKGIEINPYNLVDKKIEYRELIKSKSCIKLYFDNFDMLEIINKYGVEHDGVICKDGLTRKYKIEVDKSSDEIYAIEAGDEVAQIVNCVVVAFSPTSTKPHCKLCMGVGIYGLPCENVKVEVEKK